MTNNEFKLQRIGGVINIENAGQGIAISQAADTDIIFTASSEYQEVVINSSSRSRAEWQSYIVFESLMKSLVGRFILSGDYKSDYASLPEDFFDFEQNTITWHSDGGTDNVLRLSYSTESIVLSMTKSKDAPSYYTNVVRIRTSGSEYGLYYQEFTEFFRQLCELERRVNPQEVVPPESPPMQRKRTIFKPFKGK